MRGRFGSEVAIVPSLICALAGQIACVETHVPSSMTLGTDADTDGASATGSGGGEDVPSTSTGTTTTGDPMSSSGLTTSSPTSSSSGSTSDAEPECGDGVHDPATEECDEGVDNSDHGDCTGECVLNVCGDGLRHDGVEECDLGPANHDSPCGGCTTSCTFGAYCGDGNTDPECGELCDGGDSPDGLACSETCRFDGAKLVFVTPGTYSGDLTAYTERPTHDGVDAADWICHELADAAGLIEPPAEDDEPPEPRFRAWVSAVGLDELGEPIELEEQFKTVENRFNSDHTGFYLTRDGTKIAEGWAGLKSGELLAPITATTEPEMHLYDVSVWTNTRSDGTMNQSFLSCLDWTYDGELGGAIGNNGSVTAWTFIANDQGIQNCALKQRLYCVEQ